MPLTQYDRYQRDLDPDRISREITSSGSVIARGVSAPYEGAPTPCVTQTFKLNEPDLQYVFTDALTGCAGLIAVSGDIVPHTTIFKTSSALVIHDKGGDKLESSQKLLEDFFIAQQKEGHTRMRLIWGNGIVKGAIHQTHTFDTEQMVNRLAQKYSHLDIKHLSEQMALIVDKKGNPINLSGTPLCDVAKMETICQSGSDIDIQIDLNFERRFQKEFIPIQEAEHITNPIDEINNALLEGKFPPVWLIQSDETMKSYLDNKTAKIPTSGGDASHYSALTTKIKEHPNHLLQEIGKQLDEYKLRYMQYSWGTSKDSGKAELMSRKWWAMVCMATELMEGLEKKPVRRQLFDKDFFKASMPRSMDGVFSKTAASLVEKVDIEFILSQKIQTIDGSKKPDQTDAHDDVALMRQIPSNEPTKFEANH